MILPDCREARKEASHRTVYESAEGTGIKTNHNLVQAKHFFACSAIPMRGGVSLLHVDLEKV